VSLIMQAQASVTPTWPAPTIAIFAVPAANGSRALSSG
jgi:hypothetical protein